MGYQKLLARNGYQPTSPWADPPGKDHLRKKNTIRTRTKKKKNNKKKKIKNKSFIKNREKKKIIQCPPSSWGAHFSQGNKQTSKLGTL
jgi:hypothetical protein